MYMRVLPPTTQKAAQSTCEQINEKIRNQTLRSISRIDSDKQTIVSDKIQALNHEWDTERVLETNAASVVLLSSVLGYKRTRCCWFMITGAVGFFLMQHALQGWCPPLPVIRKLGVRTAEEIQQEKTVLKMIRGDFSGNTEGVHELLKIAEKD